MGLIRAEEIGTGMNFERISDGANFDIIVTGISSEQIERTATLKVKGIEGLDEICIRQGEPNINIVEGVTVGIPPNSYSKHGGVKVFYDAPEDFYLYSTRYRLSEYQ